MKEFFYRALMLVSMMSFSNSCLRAEHVNPAQDFFVCHSASDPHECAYYVSQYAVTEKKDATIPEKSRSNLPEVHSSLCSKYSQFITSSMSSTIGLPVMVALLPVHALMGIVCVISNAREEK